MQTGSLVAIYTFLCFSFNVSFSLRGCLVYHSINIIDVVSQQTAAEGDAGEQQPGGESMEAEES